MCPHKPLRVSAPSCKKIGSCNTQHIITSLDALHDAAEQDRSERPRFVVVWDNVCFHRAVLVRSWCTDHKLFEVVYSFLNTVKKKKNRLEDGVYMTAYRRPACLYCGQGNRPTETLRYGQSMGGFGTQGTHPPTHNCRVFLCLQYSCVFFGSFLCCIFA